MKQRIAVVTGAGSGIGRAVALGLAESDFYVVLTGRTRSKLEETLALSEKPDHMVIIPSDVSDPASVHDLFKEVWHSLGRLDLLFNNAGTNITGPLEDLTYEDWKTVIDTNLTGAFLCCQAAFRIMKKQSPTGGRIINNGSISAHVPRPEAVAYTCSKHAITGLTKSTALEGRKYDICCSQIDIGNVDTAMVDRMKSGTIQADGNYKVEPTFDLRHVVDAIHYMANLPLSANVQFMTVMASKMPYIGRG